MSFGLTWVGFHVTPPDSTAGSPIVDSRASTHWACRSAACCGGELVRVLEDRGGDAAAGGEVRARSGVSTSAATTRRAAGLQRAVPVRVVDGGLVADVQHVAR